MRKLALLATTAIAAVAIFAIGAAPAQADQEIVVTDPNGSLCDPCLDTGYGGKFEMRTLNDEWAGECDVKFDLIVQADGSFETYNTVVGYSSYYCGAMYSCGDSWQGQIRVPDKGPAQVDLETCLKHFYTGEETKHEVVFEAFNGPRRWEQLGEALGWFKIVDFDVEDGNESDNIKVVVL